MRERLADELVAIAGALVLFAALRLWYEAEVRAELLERIAGAWDRLVWPFAWPSSPRARFARSLRERLLAEELAEQLAEPLEVES